MTITLDQEAVADLDAIWDYTFETWSFDQANRYIEILEHKISQLWDSSYAWRTPFPDFPIVKQQAVRRHFIYFVQADDTLRVIGIFHQQMDLETQLAKRSSQLRLIS